MNWVPVIVSDEQSIPMLPMNHSLILMRNYFESNYSKCFSSNTVKSRLDASYYLIQNKVGNSMIAKMSYLIAINRLDASA